VQEQGPPMTRPPLLVEGRDAVAVSSINDAPMNRMTLEQLPEGAKAKGSIQGVFDQRLRELDRNEHLGKPSIVTLLGNCLGGSLELPLACHFHPAAEKGADALHVHDERGEARARGLCSFAADEAKLIARNEGVDVQDLLGYKAALRLINPDNLVVLEAHHLPWEPPEEGLGLIVS
jgi:hypothetical protein